MELKLLGNGNEHFKDSWDILPNYFCFLYLNQPIPVRQQIYGNDTEKSKEPYQSRMAFVVIYTFTVCKSHFRGWFDSPEALAFYWRHIATSWKVALCVCGTLSFISPTQRYAFLLEQTAILLDHY